MQEEVKEHRTFSYTSFIAAKSSMFLR